LGDSLSSEGAFVAGELVDELQKKTHNLLINQTLPTFLRYLVLLFNIGVGTLVFSLFPEISLRTG
jgi:hypothetical protein